MNSRLVLTLCFTLLSMITQSQSIDEKQSLYVADFVGAVNRKDSEKVIKLLDKRYAKEQIRFLDGRKSQFVNELFSGTASENEQFMTPIFEEMSNFSVETIRYTEDGLTVYLFTFNFQQFTITSELLLGKKGKRYGFIGARG